VTDSHPQGGNTPQKESDEMQTTPGNAAAQEKEVVVVVVEGEKELLEESRQFARESFPASHILTSSPITIQEIQSRLRAGTFSFCL
jgi:hypothetical protein